MDDVYKAVIRKKTSYLIHYNHNHDKLGRFARSNGVNSVAKQQYKKAQEKYAQERDDAWEIRKTDNTGFREKMRQAQQRLGDAYLDLIAKQNQKAENHAKYVMGENGDESFEQSIKRLHDVQESAYEKLSDTEKKDVIKVNNKNTLSKNDINIKSAKDTVGISKGLDVKKGSVDISLSMESSIKTYKHEVRTSGGVHIIESKPTSIEFNNVEHSSGAGLDKNKVKTLDSFSRSKESNKAIYEGRDLIASTRKDTQSQDWSPTHISYGFNNDKPTINYIDYIYKRDSGDQDYVTVEFDDKLKPGNPWHA